MVDVQIATVDAGFRLRWQAHESGLRTQSSGNGERCFPTLSAAEAAAEDLFGIAADAWPFVAPERPLTPAEVHALVRLELAPYQERGETVQDWGALIEPPRRTPFRTHDGHQYDLWLVLEAGSYVVFYDEESGDYGLGSRAGDASLAYIGDYGPLWLTLMSI